MLAGFGNLKFYYLVVYKFTLMLITSNYIPKTKRNDNKHVKSYGRPNLIPAFGLGWVLDFMLLFWMNYKLCSPNIVSNFDVCKLISFGMIFKTLE